MAPRRAGAAVGSRAGQREPQPGACRHTGRSPFLRARRHGSRCLRREHLPPRPVAFAQDEHLCPDVGKDEAMTDTNMRDYEIVLA